MHTRGSKAQYAFGPSSRRAYWMIRMIGGITLLVSVTACSALRPTGTKDYRVVGYVHGPQGVDVDPLDAMRLTHINYAFANVRDGGVVLEYDSDTAHLAQLRALKAHNPNLKILLSVGGWTWSENFSDAALTEASRATFARSAIALMVHHNLDGLDIDWEYPGQKGEDNVFRPEDKDNFTLLLKTLRTHLDRQSRRDGRRGNERYELTIATGASATYLAHTNLREAQVYLDGVNIMTYDFYGSWTTHTGHHANLYPSARELYAGTSVVAAVERHLDAGVPREKLVVGTAFYGYGWTNVQAANQGLYQPYEGEATAYGFDTLTNTFIDQNGFVAHWDDEAKAPYLWNADSTQFISYENERSLRYKADFVKDKGLAGVMYWAHSHNADGRLLQVLHQTLHPRSMQLTQQ